MWLLLWLAVSTSASMQQSGPVTPPAASQAVSSKIWIGRYSEFEDFIRSAKIERMKEVGSGVTRPRHGYFAPGGLTGGVVVKNLPPGRKDGAWESYQSEIAAYKLDRLLQLDMVPPTVERSVDGTPMSVQLWADNVRTIKENNGRTAPDVEKWNFQVFRQRVFHNLIGNIDPNGGNILIDPVWNVILVDHSRSFTSAAKMPFPLTKIDRPFYNRLKALDADAVKQAIGNLMPPGGSQALIKRRDEIVKTFTKLAADKGEAQVFLP